MNRQPSQRVVDDADGSGFGWERTRTKQTSTTRKQAEREDTEAIGSILPIKKRTLELELYSSSSIDRALI